MRLAKKFQKKTLYNSIITYITKKGNKELATKLVNEALLKASKKLKLGSQLILAIAFKNLNVCVEVKDVSRRGKIFKIPFPITLKRQRYLSIKWFFKAVDEDTRACSYSEKIFLELVNLVKTKKAKSISYKEQNIKLAIANRSNIHYRW